MRLVSPKFVDNDGMDPILPVLADGRVPDFAVTAVLPVGTGSVGSTNTVDACDI